MIIFHYLFGYKKNKSKGNLVFCLVWLLKQKICQVCIRTGLIWLINKSNNKALIFCYVKQNPRAEDNPAGCSYFLPC